jgi:pimeloyl-ACP methyl ester carboxylesterase
MNKGAELPLNYIDGGVGPAVVMIHGMAASLYDWAALGACLEREGFRCIAPDLLGHGDSPKPGDPEAYGLKNVYAALENWVDSLELGEPAHFIGHSLGGYLSLKYALRFPEKVRSLVLINPLYYIAQLAPVLRIFRKQPHLGIRLMAMTPLRLIETFMAWDPTNPENFSAEATRQIALDYKRASPYILNITKRIPDLTPELPFLSPPTLLIWGDSDLTLDPASFPRLAARIPNLSGAHLIHGSGHQPHIGKPEKINQMILDFMRGVEKNGSRDMPGRSSLG